MDARATRFALVVGAVAGDLSVPGIKTTDKILSVQSASVDIGTGAWTVADLTDEFTITDADTLNNDGGTDSDDGIVAILYISANERGGAIR